MAWIITFLMVIWAIIMFVLAEHKEEFWDKMKFRNDK